MNTSEETGEVWRGGIVERMKTTLQARIKKEWGKHVERMERYSNDEDALRLELGIDPEADESGAVGGLVGAARGDGGRALQQDQGANLRVLDDAALLREPVDMALQVEENDSEEGNAPIIILWSYKYIMYIMRV